MDLSPLDCEDGINDMRPFLMHIIFLKISSFAKSFIKNFKHTVI